MTGERILIIEDDPEQVEFLLTRVLLPSGYLAQAATNAHTGLSAAREERPDLILLDLSIPDAAYTEMLQQLHVSGDAPVILLAPPGAEVEALRAIRMGAWDALIQPFSAPEAARMIARVLQQERLATERDQLVRRLAWANQSLEQSLTEAKMLFECAKAVSSSLYLDDVLTAVVQSAVSLTQAEEGYLLLSDPGSDKLFLRALKQAGEAQAAKLCVQVDDSIARHVLRTREPVALSGENSASVSIRCRRRVDQASHLVKSVVNVPLQNQQRVIGVIGVDNVVSNKSFTQNDVARLSTLADFAAISLGNAHSYTSTFNKLSSAYAEAAAAQHKADLILRNISEGVYTVDTDLRITSANPAIERITGWRESELLGRRYDEVFAPQENGHRLAPNETAPGRALQIQSSVPSTQITILSKDKCRVSVIGTAVLLRAADASVAGVLATMSNLSPDVMADHSDGDLSEILPFQSYQLDQLIEETLDTVHLEVNGAPSNSYPVTLRPIISQAVRNVQGTTSSTSFHVTVAPDLPFAVGNETKIELALVNLVENALIVGDQEKPILISAEADDDGVVVTVECASPPVQDIEIVQVEHLPNDRSRLTDGKLAWWATPQMKLFIARKLIQAQGGRVWMEDRPGTGPRFCFSLPKIEVKDVAQAFID